MFIAEREGFEPPVPLSTAVFKTAVIDHSTISPSIFPELVVFLQHDIPTEFRTKNRL